MRHAYKYFLMFAVALLMGVTPSFAQEDSIIVEPNEAVIVVHGIVCSFCSQGVTKKLSKLPFIDSSKYTKGVKVEIEDQKVTIAIQPGVEPDFAKVFSSIKSGGYEPIEAYTSEGKVTMPEDI